METLRIRLIREPEPPSGDDTPVRFGLQDRVGGMHDGMPRSDGLVQFDFDVSVRGVPEDGPPDFAGPFVSGTRGERFVYLSWQRRDGAGFVNRIKVRLTDLDWPLIAAAQGGGKRLEANLRGASAGGGKRPVEWRLAEA